VDHARLALRAVSKDRGGRRVLDRVDLDLHAGELLVLTGANGAGKSTLWHVAAGLCHATGEVRCDGWVGWFGEPGPMAIDVDGLLAWVVGARGRGDPSAIRRRLPLAQGPIDRLSAGQRRLALFAASLVAEPDVLLLDEPLTHLDQAGIDAVLAAVAAERRRGVAVGVATHRPEAFAADRRLTLADGRLR
jgi:ABC-type multidrug transport system ATPase subunit